ncbi:hypothetical protein QIT55_gp31 [Nitrosopumilus spindle-shaped virus]|uniref:Uncharacterized protein n=1 Tax=Nitrosopumilus spindle-shaped virus 1 TaxID=2848002 RepID=A0A514K303_9VIRU|nr:hypothetical protein QIT55_gp31 [Nitrosopumilus spindle-shaped virus]QDI74017.1 hypothetical protein [Nitrosopumilus spindle-shaped virus]
MTNQQEMINPHFAGLIVVGIILFAISISLSNSYDAQKEGLRTCEEIFDRHDQGIEETKFKTFDECENYISSYEKSLGNASFAMLFGAFIGIGMAILGIFALIYVKDSTDQEK